MSLRASSARRRARQVSMEGIMFLKRLAIVSLVSIFLAAQVTAQTPDGAKLPDTPAGRTLAAFLTPLNSGNLETLRRFHSERGGNENNAQEDMNFYNQRRSVATAHCGSVI